MEQDSSLSKISVAIVELTSKVDTLMSKLDMIIEQRETPGSEELIGIEEACRIVNLEKSTIYAKVQSDAIPYYKPGKKLLFKRGELLQWMFDRQQSSNESKKSEILAKMQMGIKHRPKNRGNIP